MASGTANPSSGSGRAPSRVPVATYEAQVDQGLRKAGRQVKGVDVAAAVMALVAGVLAYLWAGAIIDHWLVAGGLGFSGRLTLWAVLMLGAGFYFFRFVLPPLVHRINPIFAAHTIERSEPSLKNSLINFLLLRGHRQEVVPVIYQALEQRAAEDLKHVSIEAAVDHRRVLRTGYVMAAIITIICVYLVFSPKDPLVSFARLIWPWAATEAPTRAHIGQVEPGDATAFHGDFLTVAADVTGLKRDERVTLFYTTADDQTVNEAVPLSPPEEGYRWRCTLPPGSLGLQQDLQYYLVAGDAHTRPFKVHVQINPIITVDRVDYHYPAYTGIPDRSVEREGDLRAIEGTQVVIHATANEEIARAEIDLDCTGLPGLKMSALGSAATGQFTLHMKADDPSRQEHDCYQLRSTDRYKRENRQPIRHRIDVIPDLPPEVQVVEPTEAEVQVPEGGQLEIGVQSHDPDFALRQVAVRMEHQGKPLPVPPLLNKPQPQEPFKGEFQGSYRFQPKQLGLKAGDEVIYWAEAEDNKAVNDQPAPNRTETAKRRITIVASNAQGGQGQPQAGPGKPGLQKPKEGGPQQRGKQPPDKNQAQPDQPQPNGPDNKNPQKKDDKQQPDGQPKNGDKGQPDKQGSKSDQSQPGQEGKQGDNSGQAGQGSKQPQQTGQQPGNSGDQSQAERKPIDPDTNPGDAVEVIRKYQEEQKQQQAKANPDQGQPQSGQQSPDQNQQANASQPQKQQDQQEKSGDSSSKGSESSSGDQKGNQQSKSGQQPSQGAQPNQDQSQKTPGQDSQAQPSSAGKEKPSETGSASKSSTGQPKPGESGKQPSGDQQPNAGAESKPSAGQESAKQPSGDQKPSEKAEQPAGGSQGKNQPSSGQKGEQKPGQSAEQKGDQKAGQSEQSQMASADQKQPNAKPDQSQAGQSSEKPDADKEKGNSAEGKQPQTADKQPAGSGQEKGQPSGTEKGQTSKEATASNQPSGDKSAAKEPGQKQPGGDKSGNQQTGQMKPGDQQQPSDKQAKKGEQQLAQAPGEKQPGEMQTGKKDTTESGQGKGDKTQAPGQPDQDKRGQPDQKMPKSDANGGLPEEAAGKAGAGKPSTDKTGSPSAQEDNRKRNQEKSGEPGKQSGTPDNAEKAKSPTTSPKQSDSKGDSEGDRSGGGKDGGGQKSKQAGTGSAGTKTDSQEGGSKSDQPGQGETGQRPGDAAKSDKPTGKTAANNEGQGSRSGEKPGQEKGSEGSKQSGQASSTSSAQPSQPQNNNENKSDQSNVASGGTPVGGQPGKQVNPPPQSSPSEEPGGDDPNLAYAAKQFDMVLESLKEQLAKEHPDPELLKRLGGWSRADLERFYQQWEQMRHAAGDSGAGAATAKKDFRNALQSLGLRPRGTSLKGGQTQQDQLRDLRQSQSTPPPAKWGPLMKAYTESVSRQK